MPEGLNRFPLAPGPLSVPGMRPVSPAGPRAVLALAVALAAGVALLSGQDAATAAVAAADPELTRLLRGMAALKAGIALGAAALVWWRLGHPLTSGLRRGYIAAAALMAAGPVLMWQIAPVAAAALLFHAGMGLLLASCWLDRAGRDALILGTRLRVPEPGDRRASTTDGAPNG